MASPDGCSSLRSDYYNVNDVAIANTSVTAYAATANSHKNGFVISTDLECFNNRNSVLLCGLNTLSVNTFLDIWFNTVGPTTSYTLDLFGNYDVIYLLDDTGLLVKKS